MDYSQFIGLAGAPFITALCQLIKGYLPSDRYVPSAALLLGVALNIAVAYNQGGDMLLAVLVGITTGLAASGLYSQTKTAVGG